MHWDILRCVVAGTAMCLMAASHVLAQDAVGRDCPTLPARHPDNFGPFDYTNPAHRKRLPEVENYHFYPQIEALVQLPNKPPLGGDISYTLNKFPNHHRALNAIVKLALREHTDRPKQSWTIECHFKRAIGFKTDDGTVRLIFSIWLHRTGKLDRALDQLLEADRLLPDNANVKYNLGLLHLDRKEYEQAKENARRAYELGTFPPGLKNKLIAAGHWNEQP